MCTWKRLPASPRPPLSVGCILELIFWNIAPSIPDEIVASFINTSSSLPEILNLVGNLIKC